MPKTTKYDTLVLLILKFFTISLPGNMAPNKNWSKLRHDLYNACVITTSGAQRILASTTSTDVSAVI